MRGAAGIGNFSRGHRWSFVTVVREIAPARWLAAAGGGLCAVGQRSSEWKPSTKGTLGRERHRIGSIGGWVKDWTRFGLWGVERSGREKALESPARGMAACRGRALCAKVGAVAMLAQVTRCPPHVV